MLFLIYNFSMYLFFKFADYSKVSRFLNRILGLNVGCQNALFTYFIETMNSMIKDAKRSGRWDEGILGKGNNFAAGLFSYQSKDFFYIF